MNREFSEFGELACFTVFLDSYVFSVRLTFKSNDTFFTAVLYLVHLSVEYTLMNFLDKYCV